jgi:hypothetical protein
MRNCGIVSLTFTFGSLLGKFLVSFVFLRAPCATFLEHKGH